MYHVSTVGALNSTQLAQRGDLPTVLDGAALLVGAWGGVACTVECGVQWSSCREGAADQIMGA